jgi:hypothetical protein
MEGSRLFVTSIDQKLAREWVDKLRSRMRARKMFDRLPGTDVVVHPWGAQQAVVPHVDRLHERHVLSRGGMFCLAEYAPTSGVVDETLDEWIERQARCVYLARMIRGWGDPYPRILFVGDRYNGERGSELPFSNRNGASRTLSTLLEHARIPESKMYLVNAYARDGRPTLTRVGIASTGAWEIVALGRETCEHLHAIGVPSFVQFPHPQFLGRWAPKQLESWGDKLRGLVEHVL